MPRIRAWLLVVALLIAPLAPAAPGASGQSATGDDSTGLATVRAAYDDMLDLFYKPLEPRGLLQAGWARLTLDAQARGAPSPPGLPPLPDGRDEAFALFAASYDGYVGQQPAAIPAAVATSDVATGMAQSVREAHTNFLPPPAFRSFLTSVAGGQSAVGLGIRLDGRTRGLVTAVAPGGPAERAGIQPGDLITAVDGADLSLPAGGDVTQALAGPAGSTAALTVDRGSGPLQVSVERGAFYFPPLESRLLPGGIGYLRLSEFVVTGTQLPDGTELLADLDRRLDQLDAQGAQGLVLDLRDNGGGSVMTADELLGRFLPEWQTSDRSFDERGHQSAELVGGIMHARQLPMALLVNASSASASEITASTLRDARRAVLVGEPTGGHVAGSELLPLPGGSGMQIAVAGVTATSGAPLDGVGVPVDVAVADTRTTDDYRAGRDPQLEAAVAALAAAPGPPAIQSTPTGTTQTDLDRLLGALLPPADAVPTNDRLTVATAWGRQDYLHPNELIDGNGGARDPVALQGTFRARGYQGTVAETYGAAPGDQPVTGVEIDLYATAEGAHDAIATNDFPDMQALADSPVSLGDETVAYQGTWLAQGASSIAWRRGRMLLSVSYSDVPGFERPDTLAALARIVDDRAQATPAP